MIKCPKCSADNPDGARFCKACGTPIPSAGGEKRCPNGHIMDPTWTFCPICEPNRQRTPHKKSVGRKKTVVDTENIKTRQQPEPRRKTRVENPASSSVSQSAPKQRRKTVVCASRGNPPKGAVQLPRLVGFLITYSREPSGAFFVLREGRHIIGAGDKTDITIENDGNMSAKHAVLLYRRGIFLMRDNLSTNGTFLNGREVIGDVQLNNYDKIKMGNTEFTLISIDPSKKQEADPMAASSDG